jgi:hypothetical protein
MIRQPTQTLADLYMADETAWLDAMAELVRRRRLDQLDYDHLAEYLEDMAIRDRREISSRLRVLIVHVLKWTYQKNMRTPSWETTVLDQQAELEEPLAKGVLRNHAEEVLADIYKKAVKYAARQTKLPAKSFPKECPWTLDQLLAAEVLDQ